MSRNFPNYEHDQPWVDHIADLTGILPGYVEESEPVGDRLRYEWGGVPDRMGNRMHIGYLDPENGKMYPPLVGDDLWQYLAEEQERAGGIIWGDLA